MIATTRKRSTGATVTVERVSYWRVAAAGVLLLFPWRRDGMSDWKCCAVCFV
jgi:hypothetical protein